MAIHVTPIPSTIELAAPAFSLGTTNTAGAATTAVSSNSTLLTFDASNPAVVAAAASVGSAAVASRRDHQHVGVAAITSTDEAIARYAGIAGALQNYTSLAPLLSDAGILTLTSGALKFPATQIVSADANTLDDFELGSWTPGLGDSSHDGSGESQVYSSQVGRYMKLANFVYVTGYFEITNLGTLNTGSYSVITGLPFTAENTVSVNGTMQISRAGSLALGAAGNNITGLIQNNEDYIRLFAWDTTAGTSSCLISELSVGADIDFNGWYWATG